jgi:hypothetical protein
VKKRLWFLCILVVITMLLSYCNKKNTPTKPTGATSEAEKQVGWIVG